MLFHLTLKQENLLPILKHGFAPVFNTTRIQKKIYTDLGIQVPEIERGMVCFSEVSVDNIDEDRDALLQFGRYGIGVNFECALDNGLKQVAYIAIHCSQ